MMVIRILSFFHGMASARQRANKICYLMEGDTRREVKEDISHTIEDHFTALYKKEERERPLLNNLAFKSIGAENADWLERPFEEEEVRQAVFHSCGDKAPWPDGFPLAFF